MFHQYTSLDVGGTSLSWFCWNFAVLQVAKVATGWRVPSQATEQVGDVILSCGNITGADKYFKGVETMSDASKKNWLTFPILLANLLD